MQRKITYLYPFFLFFLAKSFNFGNPMICMFILNTFYAKDFETVRIDSHRTKLMFL